MERSRHKNTIIVIAAGFILFYLIFDREWLVFFSLVVLVIGIVSETLSRLVHSGWFWIAEKLGYVMSRLILGITFIFVLLPISAFARFFRKDFMMLKKRGDSYYNSRNHLFTEKDLRDPW